MAMHHTRNTLIGYILMLLFCNQAGASGNDIESPHYGIFHPNGLDLIGYSVEKELAKGIYRYYTFGFPSFAAVGLNYYGNYAGNGLTSTIGIGLGAILHLSLAYQFHIDRRDYIKIGAGYTDNLVYAGFYPVISYEQRF